MLRSYDSLKRDKSWDILKRKIDKTLNFLSEKEFDSLTSTLFIFDTERKIIRLDKSVSPELRSKLGIMFNYPNRGTMPSINISAFDMLKEICKKSGTSFYKNGMQHKSGLPLLSD